MMAKKTVVYSIFILIFPERYLKVKIRFGKTGLSVQPLLQCCSPLTAHHHFCIRIFFRCTFNRELNQLLILNILSIRTIYWRLTRKNSSGLSCFSNSSSEYEIFSFVPFFIYRHTFLPSNAMWLMSSTCTEK